MARTKTKAKATQVQNLDPPVYHIVRRIGDHPAEGIITGDEVDEYLRLQLQIGYDLEFVQSLGLEPGAVDILYILVDNGRGPNPNADIHHMTRRIGDRPAEGVITGDEANLHIATWTQAGYKLKFVQSLGLEPGVRIYNLIPCHFAAAHHSSLYSAYATRMSS